MNEVCYLTALYIFYFLFSYHNHINFAKCDDISVILRVFCDSVSSGGFRGGALGASAPPAESMVKKILTYLFSSQCTVGTFLRVL